MTTNDVNYGNLFAELSLALEGLPRPKLCWGLFYRHSSKEGHQVCTLGALADARCCTPNSLVRTLPEVFIVTVAATNDLLGPDEDAGERFIRMRKWAAYCVGTYARLRLNRMDWE